MGTNRFRLILILVLDSSAPWFKSISKKVIKTLSYSWALLFASFGALVAIFYSFLTIISPRIDEQGLSWTLACPNKELFLIDYSRLLFILTFFLTREEPFRKFNDSVDIDRVEKFSIFFFLKNKFGLNLARAVSDVEPKLMGQIWKPGSKKEK